MIGPETLFPLEIFRSYRSLCRVRGYCEPWHPYVGSGYGANDGFKLLYLGGAAWWSNTNHHPQDDQEALEASRHATYKFVEGGAYSSPFWRLLRRISQEVFVQANWDSFLRSIAWSNLTKTGLVGETAPPDSDRELVELDCQLLRHELSLLKPDLVLCVSGSIMPSVGHELFGRLLEPGNPAPSTGSTWFRNFADGSKLIWTMHPAYKSQSWSDTVISDVKTMLRA